MYSKKCYDAISDHYPLFGTMKENSMQHISKEILILLVVVTMRKGKRKRKKEKEKEKKEKEKRRNRKIYSVIKQANKFKRLFQVSEEIQINHNASTAVVVEEARWSSG